MMNEDQITCTLCGRNYVYSKRAGHQKTKCNSCSAGNRRFKGKEKGIAYKGGKCERCGYCKSKWALNFHHLDPATKSFNIGSATTRSWKVVQAELDKCILLCANCHAEEHESQQTRTEESKSWEPRTPSTATTVCGKCGGKKTKDHRATNCHKCAETLREKIVWPSNEELQRLVLEIPAKHLAKQLGVSDKSIEKRCRSRGISKPTRGYWAKLKHSKN